MTLFYSCSDENETSEGVESILTSHTWKGSPDYDVSVYGSGDDLNATLTSESTMFYFLGKGKGIARTFRRQQDTYFGYSSKYNTREFTYSVSGKNVVIGSTKHVFKDDALWAEGGTSYLRPSALNSDDYEFIDRMRYWTLPDDQRLNFEYVYGMNLFGTPIKEGSKYGTIVTADLAVLGNQKCYSRGIASIDVQFSIKGGSFSSTPKAFGISTAEDKDYSASTSMRVTFSSSATITSRITIHDGKTGRTITHTSEFVVAPGDADNNGGDNNSGDNDNPGSDNGNNSGNGNDSGSDNNLSGTNNGHEWVDLGLSVKWATCNIGAFTPEDSGYYYAWGETETKSIYDWSTYKWCDGTSTLTKYCATTSNGFVDNKTTLDLEDDVARVKWQSTWRMPTESEIDELKNKCTWTWITQNGVNGYKVTSRMNKNSIFFPAAGSRGETSLKENGTHGYYWSSTLTGRNGRALYFRSGLVGDAVGRTSGFTIRPVCP